MQHINPEQLFIFDIETVSGVADFNELDPELQTLFYQKTARNRDPLQNAAEHYPEKAGILAEFGKVIVISCGYMQKLGNGYQLKIKNYSGHDEKELLRSFSETLQNISKNNYFLCGHNIREFDVPWLCRRMLINSIPLPPCLDLYGKKPWEVNHVDTLDLWKFGDFKHYTSLHLLATVLGVPTPKDDIDGSMVGTVYWQQNDLARIEKYCSKDVIAVANVILKLKGLPLLEAENILQ